MTEHELKALQEELRRLKEKERKEKERRKEYNRRRNARNALLIQKAIEAGIDVTDEEIDEYLNKAS